MEVFEVTVPSGTPRSLPVDIDMDFNDGRVDRMDVMIPPGPSGLVGFAIVQSFQQIIPFQVGSFIIADDETIVFDLERYPQGSPWVVRAFNTDVYDHTLHFRLFITDEIEEDPLTAVAIPQAVFIPPGGVAEVEDLDVTPVMELEGEEVAQP